MRRLLVLLVFLAGCLEHRRRREDPWEKYANQPVPEGNLRIDVNTFLLSAADETIYEGAAAYRGTGWSVVAGGFSEPSGAAVFGGQGNFLAAFRAASRRARSREERTASVLVADGYEAEVRVLDQVLVPVLHVIPVYRGAVLVRTIEAVVTGSGFYVRPETTEEGRIRVEIVPFLATQEGGWGAPIRIVELSTTVELRPGQPLVLMAREEQRDSFAGAFFFSRTRTGTRRLLQVLTVRK